jgi:lysozyme
VTHRVANSSSSWDRSSKDKLRPESSASSPSRANFRFDHDALWRNPVLDEDPRSDQIFGIDISHHLTDKCHCKVDWASLVDQKVAFAYLKATQGVNYYDRSFEPNLEGIRAFPSGKKIDVGAFHFLSADGSGEDQAKNFLDVVGSKLGKDDLTPSLDVEWDVRTDASGKVILGPDGKEKDFWKGTDGSVILGRVLAWLDVSLLVSLWRLRRREIARSFASRYQRRSPACPSQ